MVQTLFDEFGDLTALYHGANVDPADGPDILYHYTDAAGLLGMIGSNQAWFTNYKFLNDQSELAYTNSLLDAAILEELLKGNWPSGASKFLEVLRARFLSYNSRYETYIFSLSEEADSLSQWRGYASEGQGFSIGFCRKSLCESRDKTTKFNILKVEYDKGEQQAALSAALRAFCQRVDSLLNKGIDEFAVIENASLAFQALLLSRSIVNKHHSFAYEREWRLVSLEDWQADPDQDVKLRARGSDLVPYTALLPHGVRGTFKDRLPIKRIGIGPGFPRSNQEYAVRSLCRQYGIAPEIYFADSPFRPT